jgi:quercetin dioxygenase-like cupin family protein
MIIKPTDFEIIYNENGAIGNKILNENGVELVELILNCNSEIKNHSLPYPVKFYVVEGKGCLYFDGKEEIIESGTVVSCPSEIQRGWKNIEEEKLKILVVKILVTNQSQN